MVCLAPRALRDSVRPRRLAGVGARPLNFTVMRHSKRIAILGAAVASLGGGCGILSYDHTRLIAAHTILNDRGALDMAAYGAALRAKFPSGSPVGSLKAYVTGTKGTCRDRDAQKVRCEIPIQGTFCVSRLIGIDALTDNGAITSIEVQSGDLTC